MNRGKAVITLVFGLLLSAPAPALACKCKNISLETKVADHPFVFIGSQTAEQLNEDGRKSAIMLISESLKGGLVANSQVVVDVGKGTSCEAYSGKDVRVLVIAGGHENALSTSRCSVYLAEPYYFEGVLREPPDEVAVVLKQLRSIQENVSK